MLKYWYVVQKGSEYWSGFAYGNVDATEEELLDVMNQWCTEKKCRLAFLALVSASPRIVNQVFPFTVTEESAMCLDNLLSSVFSEG